VERDKGPKPCEVKTGGSSHSHSSHVDSLQSRSNYGYFRVAYAGKELCTRYVNLCHSSSVVVMVSACRSQDPYWSWLHIQAFNHLVSSNSWYLDVRNLAAHHSFSGRGRAGQGRGRTPLEPDGRKMSDMRLMCRRCWLSTQKHSVCTHSPFSCWHWFNDSAEATHIFEGILLLLMNLMFLHGWQI